jgi:hypothetical protein
MLDDTKSIYNLYESNAAINNTTRNSDSYQYSAQEYSVSRNEQEEMSIKRKIVADLSNCVEHSKTGSKENYYKILHILQSIQKDIGSILNNRS